MKESEKTAMSKGKRLKPPSKYKKKKQMLIQVVLGYQVIARKGTCLTSPTFRWSFSAPEGASSDVQTEGLLQHVTEATHVDVRYKGSP